VVPPFIMERFILDWAEAVMCAFQQKSLRIS